MGAAETKSGQVDGSRVASGRREGVHSRALCSRLTQGEVGVGECKGLHEGASWAVAQGPKDAGGQYIWFSAPLHCLETYIFEQRNPNFHFALGPAN